MGIAFRACPSAITEKRRHGEPPARFALRLAREKAAQVAGQFPGRIVLGADTIVVYRDTIYGKPRTAAAARRILRRLSGTTHTVYTAVAVIDTAAPRILVDIDAAIVRTRKLSARHIHHLAEKNLDKAGGYAVQEDQDILVKKIDGNYDTVVGLPRTIVANLLRCCGWPGT
ncbi:MAG: Maf family nucleotide pyrophosphatase [Candidatus Omnitrophica bacterium]|nr:Maf family nucleotide pyrophosphatase [Candidatus Omnitrophota bacterium]